MWFALFIGCGGEVIHHPASVEDSAQEGLAITAVDPAVGVAAGGTFVRVEGQGFTSASSVAVGGSACAELTFLSSGELFCTTPPGAVGDTELVVTEAGETVSAAYVYLADEADTAEDTGEAPAVIASCTLESPVSMEVESDEASTPVIGSVVVTGRTEGEGEAPGIEAAVGFGVEGYDPVSWVWDSMSYTSSVDPTDQYTGTFYPEEVGRFVFTVRFRVDHGDWTMCTAADGSYGALEVTEPTKENPVDYCHLQWPCTMDATAGEVSADLYAWVYEGSSTLGAGQGPGVQVDVGVGDAGTDPEIDASWSWSTMSYFADKDGLTVGDKANDEYTGTFDAPATAGTYDYVARASADYGLTWTICDLGGDSCNFGGSSDGYDDPGICTVR